MITEYLAGSSMIYYIRQCAVIVAIFVFGSILCDLFLKKETNLLMRAVVAYPTGLSAFAVTAYAMLTFGIPYNTLTVTAAVLVEAGIALFLNRKSLADAAGKDRLRHMIFALGAALTVSLIACSGLIPVYISNDTMYYFKRYPECIVHYGALRDQFDSWLTDTGLGSVCLETLPSLFGFGESFGIREAFHINFLLFFGSVVYARSEKYLTGKTSKILASVIVTALLAVTTPFLILGHWALANMYFMELFFIAAYTAFDIPGSTGALSTMLIALSLLRMEGTLFAVWLVLCIAVYTDLGKKLSLYVLFPVAILFGMYCRKIFFDFYLFDDIYVFLTPQKAILLILAVVSAAIWLLIVPILPKGLTRLLPVIYIAGAVGANIVLAVRNSELYLGNLKTFGINLFGQSGWGILPHLLIGMTLILVIEYVILIVKKEGAFEKSNLVNITMTIGFILIALVASFGRGDALSDYIGDSGNRVMLQVVPLVVMMYAELFMGIPAKRDR